MSNARAVILASIPALFVLLWSTGWISARAAAPYADPLTFLVVRYALAAAVLGAIALAAGIVWQKTPQDRLAAMLSGVLLHAGYLGPVWYAISMGVPTGVSGVLAAMQPLLTAALAPRLLGEPVSARQWAGIGCGFLGILLVLQPALSNVAQARLDTLGGPILVNVAGMISVTLGTIYQKRFVGAGDLRGIATLQYIGAALATAPVALALEPLRLVWTLQTVVTLAWSVLAISVAGILALLWLLREGAVARTAALIYLVPPVVAIEAWLLFGETVTPVQVCGIAVVCLGVALAVRR
jgi:drug/metabolite transporter (DMT)-like permease